MLWLNSINRTFLRPLFSQGDLAVGRITRLDVAQVLVSLLEEKNGGAAVGKTIEVLALSGVYTAAVASVSPISIKILHDEIWNTEAWVSTSIPAC